MGSIEHDLRVYESQQVRAEQDHERAVAKATEQAAYDVCDADVVRELVYDYELDPATCLARCFVNLDRACNGEQIARDAITTALHYLRRDMRAKLVEVA